MAFDDWQRVKPTKIIGTDFHHLVDKTFILPDGKPHVFTTFKSENSHAAGAIALTPDNLVIVARQFRPGPERVMEEIPGGGVEAGEDYQKAAERELLEETGYRAGTVELLGTSCRDGYNNMQWHYYLARNCVLSGHGQELDETEHIEVALLTIDQFLAAAMEDRVTDNAAVLFAYEKLLAIKHEHRAT